MTIPTPESLNVSRETLDRLTVFADLLKKWNPKINLVSRGTIEDMWVRHIQDSAQIFHLQQSATSWVDLGSGGGLPGLVVAILVQEKNPDLHITMIESDQRKCAFLRTVSRELSLKTSIIAERIEAASGQDAAILSARALAPLDVLLGFVDRHMAKDGTALLPKGAQWKKEVDNAQIHWRFDYEAITSVTEEKAVILKVKGVERV